MYSAIQKVGATPNRVAVIYRFLAGIEGQKLERKKLSDLVGPKCLSKREGTGEVNAFTECISLGKELGLFLQEGKTIRLVSWIAEEDIEKTFNEKIANRLVDSVQSANSPEGYVAGIIAWMLLQDPRVPLKWTDSSSVELLKLQFDTSEAKFGMSNFSAFQQAVYWARTLGFVVRANIDEEVVIPDPTLAIERRIEKVLPKKQEKPLSEFISDLAKCCPVFEGGSVRIELEHSLKRDSSLSRDQNTVSLSTALALHRLQRRDMIGLSRKDDGQTLYVKSALNDGRVTHISRS